MKNSEQTNHQSLSKRVYTDALDTAMSDRVMLSDELLAQDNPVCAVSPELKAVYEGYSWAAHSLKARSWLQSVFVFNLLLMAFDYLVSPSLLVATLVIRGVIVSTILVGLYLLWGRQRPNWVQGATLLALSVTIMLESGALGALGGDKLFERYLTAGLFTVATATVFFPIEFRWTIAAIIAAVTLHGGMIAIGPVADPLLAMSISLFYSGAILTFASTRRATLRSQWISFKSKIRELRDQETLARLYTELQLVANLDPLTGIQNRRSTEKDIDQIWSNPTEVNPGVAFLMLDIDNFKNLNDTLGHAARDDCIKSVAGMISDTLRDGDIVSRYGGEEFLIVLTRTSPSGALAIAERVRKSIESLKIENPGGNFENSVTVSIGLALWEGDQTPQMLINRADEALYIAKRKGRNQTVISPPPSGVGAGSGQVQKQKSQIVA